MIFLCEDEPKTEPENFGNFVCQYKQFPSDGRCNIAGCLLDWISGKTGKFRDFFFIGEKLGNLGTFFIGEKLGNLGTFYFIGEKLGNLGTFFYQGKARKFRDFFFIWEKLGNLGNFFLSGKSWEI